MKCTSILLVASMTLFGCSTSAEGEVAEAEAVEMEKYVEPVASFMQTSSGVQLFSYFDEASYKEEKTTISTSVDATGSMGGKSALFVKSFTVKKSLFAPYVLVSEADGDKVKNALKEVAKEGKKEVTVVFEGKFTEEGSDQSPFSGELRLCFANGKVLSVQ